MEVSIVIGATPIAGFLEHPKMKCGWELEVPPFRNLPLYHQGCSIYWRLGCTPYMSLSPYVEKKLSILWFRKSCSGSNFKYGQITFMRMHQIIMFGHAFVIYVYIWLYMSMFRVPRYVRRVY
jgi:hypothetical protein